MTSRDLRRALSTAIVAVPVMTIVGWILGLPAWSQTDPPPNALVGAAWGAVIGVVLSLLSAFVAGVRESLWAAPPAGEESAVYRTEQRAVRDAVVRTFPTALTVLAVAAGISALSPAIVGRLTPAIGVVVVIVLFRARVASNRKDLSLDE